MRSPVLSPGNGCPTATHLAIGAAGRLLSVVLVTSVLLAIDAVPAMAADPTLRAVSAGGTHSCGRTSDGLVWCWGRNNIGQIGDGTQTSRLTPVRVTTMRRVPLTEVTALSTGYQHNCARTASGAAWCWGSNEHGQLGDGTTSERLRAVRVRMLGGAFLTGVTSVSAGGTHSCARTSDGAAWCWGASEFGQLGDGTTIERHGAVQVTKADGTPLAGVTMVSAGAGYHSCAATHAGAAWCWGYNGYRQLGDRTATDRWRAGRVTKSGGAPLTKVVSVSAGGYHSCARTSAGRAWCWGSDGFGQLGDGTTGGIGSLAQVMKPDGTLLSGVTAISASLTHSCASTGAGAARCWGSNGYGELGNGTTTARPVAVRVQQVVGGVLDRVIAASAGGLHACARTADGAAWCWGLNEAGQLGDGTATDRHRAARVVATWAS